MKKQETTNTSNVTFIRIGYWSAIACGIGAIAYAIVSIIVAVLGYFSYFMGQL